MRLILTAKQSSGIECTKRFRCHDDGSIVIDLIDNTFHHSSSTILIEVELPKFDKLKIASQLESIVIFVKALRTKYLILESDIFGDYIYIDQVRNRSKSYDSNTLPSSKFVALFQDVLVEYRNDFLLRIEGMVTNIGTEPWISSIEIDSPYRVGMLISTQDNDTVVLEDRFNFKYGQLNPNQKQQFYFDINPSLLSEGIHRVVISVVKETSFWFHELDSKPFVSELNIKRSKKIEATPAHFINLPAVKSNLLFICPTLPRFDQDTGSKRLFKLLKELIKLGFKITYAYDSEGSQGDHLHYIQELKEQGIHTTANPLEFLSHVSAVDYQGVVLGWHDCASKYIHAVKHYLPQSKIIIDSVDLHYVREERGVKAGLLNFSEDELVTRKSKELSVYRQANEVWVVSNLERTYLEKEIPDQIIRVIPIVGDWSKTLQKENNYSNKKIVFVGNYAHPPNIDAALRAIEIVERVQEITGERWEILIVGPNSDNHFIKYADTPWVTITGFVKDLSDLYSSCDLFLAPLTYGAGVKGKIIEAAVAGIPVFTTDIGNEGIMLKPDKEIFICESNEDFAQKIIKNQKNLRIIAKNAQQKMASALDENQFLKILSSAFCAPSVVIAIVTYNKNDLLKKCLSSILQHTIHSNYSIFVMSNGCTDGTAEYLKALNEEYPDKINFRINDTNDYFIYPNNWIIQNFPENDILLLNNDVQITDPKWLTELQHAAYQGLDVGASGPMVIDSKHIISEFGSILFEDGTARNFHRGTPADAFSCKTVSTGFVSGCCLYMKRDAIRKVGILNEELHPMYYEDVEWQYRLHRNNLKSIVTSRTSIIHDEGSTAGTDTLSGMKRYQEINRLKILKIFSGKEIKELNKSFL